MIKTQNFFKESSHWVRLALCANRHLKRSLIGVLHNDINDSTVKGCPSDPHDLYMFLQENEKKIQKSRTIKAEQKSILLPATSESVDSSSMDISLIRWLIQTFCHIKNANGKWDKPNPSDKTICAFVHRAADIRNTIFHYNNVDALDETTFEKMWKEIEDILIGLKYVEDIKSIKTVEFFDPAEIQGEILQEFRDHLESYKSECSTKSSADFYIQRKLSENENENNIVTKIDEIIKENRRVMIFGDAGIGKSTTARHIKQDWAKGEVLNDFHLLFFNSKQINQKIQYPSYAAPLFFSELGNHLTKKGKTERNFIYYDCVTTTIDNLIILIDGVDEFPITDLVTKNYIDELETKVKNNDKISASDTINAIYFGFLFPYSKVCLLGRTNEFHRLKEFKCEKGSSIFNETNRKIIDLELLKFDDADVKDFTCFKICNQQLNGQTICIDKCKKIYEKIKTIELCNVPTDLNSLIKLYKKHPNKDIGRINRTKLIIFALLNRLDEHTQQRNCLPCRTFQDIPESKKKFIDCIRVLGEISFNAIYKGDLKMKVDEETINGVVYFNFENQAKVERKVLEELDFFYLRDFDYYFILKPHDTLSIEFLSSCFLLLHPDKWSLISKLKMDKQLVIISFIAGFCADDYFTKDFVKKVLKTSDCSIKKFLSWLYNVENVRCSLPNGGYGYACWYGLMKNQKLSPSFYLLDSISSEVEIPRHFIPQKTIVYYSESQSSKWYDLEYFRHSFLTKQTDELNTKSFLYKFPKYNFMIKGDIEIRNKEEFNHLNKYVIGDRVTFRINDLRINSSLNSTFDSSYNVNSLHIGWECDQNTIDMILDTISPSITTTSSKKFTSIQCKCLHIFFFPKYNAEQTRNLFSIGLSDVDYITLRSTFLTQKQIEILKDVERKHKNKLLNIELSYVDFDRINNLPNLSSRHVSLHNVKSERESDLHRLKQHILVASSRKYSPNLYKYKIILPAVPFVRKKDYSRESEQSMFLNLCGVYFKNVSSNVFANTFSLIPSLSCCDKDIPSSHWLSLSKIRDCQINELRVWKPKSKNFEYILKIETKILQFICEEKDQVKELLNHIVNNPIVQLDKTIKVFAVKYDKFNWNYYEEIILFSDKIIEEYKNNYSSDNILLDNINIPFHEGEQHLKYWCCEISSLNPEKSNDYVQNVRSHSLRKSCSCFYKF